MKINKLVNYAFDLCSVTAKLSKDKNTQVGCVIVNTLDQIIAMGYNGFPRGINDNIDNRYNRPDKLLYTEHAERNAIYQCAYTGNSCNKCTMYINKLPCADCARAIIQSGISKIIVNDDSIDIKWKSSSEAGLIMLQEANIDVLLYNNNKFEVYLK